MKRCYTCFQEFEEEYEICPFCGQIYTEKPDEPVYLSPGTELAKGRYILGKQIGAGGFGIVYRAYDTKLETIVAIKEFFVSRLMTRAAGIPEVIVSKKNSEEFEYRKTRFLAEARTMAQFGNHRNITNVFEFFEENKTAYIVMELLEGMTLSEYLKQCGGKLDYELAVEVALEVGNALKSLHEKQIIHRDVAPDNIFLCSTREIRIKLLDFGAARLADSTDDIIDIILKPGYSPPEQYDKTGNIGPWTDIYALGATLYAILTGEKPDESTNRKTLDIVVPPAQLNPEISENLNNTILKAMALERHLRFRNMDEFLAAIRGERKVITLAAEKKRRNIKRALQIAGACVILAAVIVAALQIFSVKQDEVGLDPTTIRVWYEAAEGSAEQEAMETVRDHFEETFPGVILELTVYPEEEYPQAIEAALSEGSLPQLFESTSLSDSLLQEARDVDAVMETEPFQTALFLDQYETYYKDHKRMPLAVEVPMAAVIISGAVGLDYEEDYFQSPEDFGADVVISADSGRKELMEMNFPGITAAPEDEFFNSTSNVSPVLLTSSMEINEIHTLLNTYMLDYVFYNGSPARGRFIYEWSLGPGEEAQTAAAERLLSWMLGNVYQSYLMVTLCQDGQIPVHAACFESKTADSDLSPVARIADSYVFERP